MTIQSQLQATLSLNTGAGSNQPAPTDTFLSTLSAGTFFLPPNTINVPATGSTVAPFSALTVNNTTSHIMIANVGASGAPNIVLDMKNVTGNSSQVTIPPGGRVYFFGVSQLPGATGANSSPSGWTLSSATATTTVASVCVVYA